MDHLNNSTDISDEHHTPRMTHSCQPPRYHTTDKDLHSLTLLLLLTKDLDINQTERISEGGDEFTVTEGERK